MVAREKMDTSWEKMDTRKKIIPFDNAATIARDKKIRVLAGRFDPLLVAHTRRIAEVSQGEPLLVLVLEYAESILPAAARAELVAALKNVGYVSVVDEVGLESLSASLDVVRDDHEDVNRQKQLLEHIRSREPR